MTSNFAEVKLSNQYTQELHPKLVCAVIGAGVQSCRMYRIIRGSNINQFLDNLGQMFLSFFVTASFTILQVEVM